MEKDPVCGMAVKSGEAAGKSEYQGKSYFFCSSACKEAFDLKPQPYVVQKNLDRELTRERS